MPKRVTPRWLLSLIVGSSLALCAFPALVRPIVKGRSERIVGISLATMTGAPFAVAQGGKAGGGGAEPAAPPPDTAAGFVNTTLTAPPAEDYLTPESVPAPVKNAPKLAAQVNDAPVAQWTPRVDKDKGGAFRWPVQGLLTSRFGPRGRGYHRGIDLAAPYGREVRAAAAGVVVEAGWSAGYGRCVVIDHGDGRQTLYGHLSRILVSQGQRVGRGELVGLVGASGWATGPHLHFEVHVGGRAVNPLKYLD